MNIVYFLAPIALMLSVGFMFAFIWAARTGQWDDLDLTPQKALQDLQSREEKNEPTK